MFASFMDFLQAIGFENREAGLAATHDPRVAAAALLCHVAEADGAISAVEFDRLTGTLAGEFGLDRREAERMANAGREADADAVDLFHFTGVLMNALDEAQRIRFVELLWRVVYADGAVHELEDNTIWRVAELLGVSTRDRMLAKRAAAASPPEQVDEDHA